MLVDVSSVALFKVGFPKPTNPQYPDISPGINDESAEGKGEEGAK